MYTYVYRLRDSPPAALPPRAPRRAPPPDWGGHTPRYYTKPQTTIQSPNRLYKALGDYTKP